jgi:hypothetical protein
MPVCPSMHALHGQEVQSKVSGPERAKGLWLPLSSLLLKCLRCGMSGIPSILKGVGPNRKTGTGILPHSSAVAVDGRTAGAE